MQIWEIFENYQKIIDTTITVNGWVKTCRNQKQMLFIHLSDGTTQKTLQIIVSAQNIDNFSELCNITTGTSLSATGVLVNSPAKEQPFELSATKIKIYQLCPTSFPLQKVGLPLEFMRTLPHLRHRSNIMRAVFVVRSKILQAIHEYFTDKNYCLVDLPMITTNACEGGCQPLQVTSLLQNGKINDIPKKYNLAKNEMNLTDDEYTLQTDIDFEKDFFNNATYLTVSNQLHLECFAHGLGYVYTITQATRGEPSQSTKHLANFNMLEWEFCFGNLEDNINIAENCIKYCVMTVLGQCGEELKLLNKASGNILIDKLMKIKNDSFIRICHKDAITLLRKEHIINAFQEEPLYSEDLTGEHERYLVKHFAGPVVVTKYPKNVKAFYMPVTNNVSNDDIEYVDCYDLLMDIGEVVGGSQRIWDEAELLNRMQELNINSKHLNWYVDLRRYGSVPHGGAGLGIERLTAAITGMTNVKDCISFPLTIHHCTY